MGASPAISPLFLMAMGCGVQERSSSDPCLQMPCGHNLRQNSTILFLILMVNTFLTCCIKGEPPFLPCLSEKLNFCHLASITLKIPKRTGTEASRNLHMADTA